MSIGYQPMPDRVGEVRRARAALVLAPTRPARRTVRSARMRRDSRMYGCFDEAVVRAHHVGPQQQLGAPSRSASAGASVCSQWRKPRLTRFASCSAAATASRGSVQDALVAVVVSRPVEHRDVACSGAGKCRCVDEPAVGPQRAFRAGRLLEQAVGEPAALLAVDLAAVDLDREAVRLGVAVVLVLLGPAGQVVLARRSTLEGEDVGEALHAARLRLQRLGMGLARLRDRLGTDPVVDARRAGAGHRARLRRSRTSAGRKGAPPASRS